MATKAKVKRIELAKTDECERRFEVYPDVGGRYRWRLVADNNGKIVSGSQQSFAHQRSAVARAIREASFYRPGTAAVVVLQETPSDA